jgi:hypothetical protein
MLFLTLGAGTGRCATWVSDPAWGYRFELPAGWVERHDATAAMVGHTTIPGMILVVPHRFPDAATVRREMGAGINDGTMSLALASMVDSLAPNLYAASYAGTVDGGPAKGRGFGVALPGGGGAFVMALGRPEQFGAPLTAAAESVARSLGKPQGAPTAAPQAATGDLAARFVGTWITQTKATQTGYTLFADGTFTNSYEASYSGQLSGGGNWGHARQDTGRGRWSVQGTPQQGVMTMTTQEDGTFQVNYRMHQERGQWFPGEYWFDGVLYGKR